MNSPLSPTTAYQLRLAGPEPLKLLTCATKIFLACVNSNPPIKRTTSKNDHLRVVE